MKHKDYDINIIKESIENLYNQKSNIVDIIDIQKQTLVEICIDIILKNKLLNKGTWNICVDNCQVYLKCIDSIEIDKILDAIKIYFIEEDYNYFELELANNITFKNDDEELYIFFNQDNSLVLPFIKEYDIIINTDDIINDIQLEQQKLDNKQDNLNILKDIINNYIKE
jgi:hypothetical protein